MKANITMRKIWVIAIVPAIAFLMTKTASASDVSATLNNAEQLLRNGRAADALALLVPLETEQAGNPNFDYLLGTAELNTDHPDLASLALERAVATEPLHAAARLDLARALYLLGDMQRAKDELEATALLNPPPSARLVINNYLSAIASKEKGRIVKVSAYMEAGIGHDSNINNATSQNQITVPALSDLIVTLSPANVQIPDSFRAVSFGGEIAVPLSPCFSWVTSGNANRRDNLSQGGFDTGGVDVKSGLAFSQDTHVIQLSALSGRMYLDNHLNRTINGSTAEVRELLDARTQLAFNTQYLRYRFPSPELAPNSFNQFGSSLGLSRVMFEGKAALSTNLIWGHEHDTDHRADGSKNIRGLQLGGRWSWNEKTDGYINLGWTTGRYDTVNPAFEKIRRDSDLYSAAGIAYEFVKDFSLRPEISLLHNRSNIPVFDFREIVFILKARYDFSS